ncbi:MAG: thioredoxin family protein [Planctomycetia bacterium]|nr:thioredoxin family protein [Planctomycetia bacterium]
MAPVAASAGKFNKVLSVGDDAPAWSELPGVDGQKHSLKDLEKPKAVVVVFLSLRCPVSTGYEPRLVAVAKDYQDKGVVVVGVNSSGDDAENLEKMKERAKSSGFTFAFLQDASQNVGKSFGATATPQVFVLDERRKIAYMGAIDDDMDAKRASRHYLREALDAALAGKTPKTAETRPHGCPIDFSGGTGGTP